MFEDPCGVSPDPGVGNKRGDRLPCPVCKVDEPLAQLNRIHAELLKRAVEQVRKSGDYYQVWKGLRKTRGDDFWRIDTESDFERHFSPKAETYPRYSGRPDRERHVAFFFDTCVSCGLLWDPYAHVRAAELNRVVGELADFTKIDPTELIAKLGDTGASSS